MAHKLYMHLDLEYSTLHVLTLGGDETTVATRSNARHSEDC